MNVSKINTFLLFKLPAAFICGVRAKSLSTSECRVAVRHRWINQNPFKSMYFAVQAMAAELSTGALLANIVKAEGLEVSMLILSSKGTFTKKATGKITFVCHNGALISEALASMVATSTPQVIILSSSGLNEQGEMVSTFEFEWSIKLR